MSARDTSKSANKKVLRRKGKFKAKILVYGIQLDPKVRLLDLLDAVKPWSSKRALDDSPDTGIGAKRAQVDRGHPALLPPEYSNSHLATSDEHNR